jgi:hypothetical protein
LYWCEHDFIEPGGSPAAKKALLYENKPGDVSVNKLIEEYTTFNKGKISKEQHTGL